MKTRKSVAPENGSKKAKENIVQIREKIAINSECHKISEKSDINAFFYQISSCFQELFLSLQALNEQEYEDIKI